MRKAFFRTNVSAAPQQNASRVKSHLNDWKAKNGDFFWPKKCGKNTTSDVTKPIFQIKAIISFNQQIDIFTPPQKITERSLLHFERHQGDQIGQLFTCLFSNFPGSSNFGATFSTVKSMHYFWHKNDFGYILDDFYYNLIRSAWYNCGNWLTKRLLFTQIHLTDELIFLPKFKMSISIFCGG
jgi:hypothetical protein